MADVETASPTSAAVAALERLGPIAVESRLISKAEYGMLLRVLHAASRTGAKAPVPARALTVKAVADRLGCCRKTVLRMIEAGRLPSVRLTGSRKSLRVMEQAVTAIAQGESSAE